MNNDLRRPFGRALINLGKWMWRRIGGTSQRQGVAAVNQQPELRRSTEAQKRARFWAEFREGQREAQERSRGDA
jgi:hypothetical protein